MCGVLLGLFGLIQLVPYGHDHTNPTATAPFKWSSSQAEAIAQRACYDCHSDQTDWWWATDIAPVSWLAQRDTTAGRARVNFSEWNGFMNAETLKYALANGMPPVAYTLAHSGAKLSAADAQQLIAGFEQSLADQQNASGLASAASTGAASLGSSSSSSSSSSATASSSSSSSPTAIIAARCSSCHAGAPAQQFRTSSAAQAQGLIDQMVQQGAYISPAEEQALVAYYTR